jgi:hypothetical protein
MYVYECWDCEMLFWEKESERECLCLCRQSERVRERKRGKCCVMWFTHTNIFSHLFSAFLCPCPFLVILPDGRQAILPPYCCRCCRYKGLDWTCAVVYVLPLLPLFLPCSRKKMYRANQNFENILKKNCVRNSQQARLYKKRAITQRLARDNEEEYGETNWNWRALTSDLLKLAFNYGMGLRVCQTVR